MSPVQVTFQTADGGREVSYGLESPKNCENSEKKKMK